MPTHGKRKRSGGAGAFGCAFVLSLIGLLLWTGLMTADYRSRQMRDGARSARSYTERAAERQPAAEQQGLYEAVLQALPARCRAVLGLWAGETVLVREAESADREWRESDGT